MGEAFRVIIVGGGPIGLLAVHCLSKAGIDFVLLERRDTLSPDSGASIGIYPSTIRIFDQLGLLGPLQKIWSPLRRKLVITHEGVIYKDHPRFSWMRAKYLLHCKLTPKRLY
jgi:2-polyprenyl-6-methoxyphenol hydroxylase-like FAD-dependent oxidoreductase